MMAALAVLCAIYVMHSATTGHEYNPPPLNCEKGSLKTVDRCKREQSDVSQKRDWNYSYATGPIDDGVCHQMSVQAQEIKIPVSYQEKPEKIAITNCKFLGLDNTHICYASQRMMEGNSDRVVTIATTDDHCGDARFFRGLNAILVNGRPQQTDDPKISYEGIPEVTY